MHLLFVPLLTGLAVTACPEPSNPEISVRVEALSSIIQQHTPAMELWWNGYIAIHAGSAAGLAGLLNGQDGSSRQESLLGVFSSSLGALTLLINPPAIFDAGIQLGRLDLSTAQGRRQYLRIAEDILAQQSKQSRFARSWLARGITLAYAVGTGLFSWRVLDRGHRAIRNFVAGVVTGQSRIFFHPTGTADAWAAYRAQYIEGCGGSVSRWHPPAPATFRWHLGTSGPGLGLTLSF